MRDWWNNLSRDKRLLVASAAGLWAAQLLYLVSPLDLLPDFIPLLGQLDDLLLLASTIAFTVYVVRKVKGDVGFSGLAPEALRPRSIVHAGVELAGQSPRDPAEADVAGTGDPLGIEGYRPLSLDEIRAL
jgi:hypothetical protein